MLAEQWPEHWGPIDARHDERKKTRMVRAADGQWFNSDREFLDEAEATIDTAAIRRRDPYYLAAGNIKSARILSRGARRARGRG